MAKDPHQTYYNLGYADCKQPERKRKRAVPYNFKLSYTVGWYDALKNSPNRYEKDVDSTADKG